MNKNKYLCFSGERRTLLVTLPTSATGCPFTAFAQAQKVHWIAILVTSSKSSPSVQAFMQELRRLGYIEGRSASFVYRVAEGNLDRLPALLPALAAEFAAEKVDVIFAAQTPPAQAARAATASIPIVFSPVSEPVGSGLIAGLARPGGNVTGTSAINVELSAKRLPADLPVQQPTTFELVLNMKTA